MAYYDDDGFFYITDRKKELIKVRGFQVAPAELEALLLTHIAVKDAAVIQVRDPDNEGDELPRAFVVLKSDDSSVQTSVGVVQSEEVMNDAVEKDIYEWVKERVAPYKRLDGGIVFVDSIPKSASGKILRRVLRDQVRLERRERP